VDFPYTSTKRFLLWHMITVTGVFSLALVIIGASDATDAKWLLDAIEPNAPLGFDGVIPGLTWSLLALALLSSLACFIHWKLSISRLYEESEMEGQEGNHLMSCLSRDPQNDATDC